MGESQVTKGLKPVIMGVINTKTRQLKGGPDLAALPSKVQKGRRPVNRKPERCSLPLSVVASLMAIVIGGALRLVHPSSLMQDVGSVVVWFGLAALLIIAIRLLRMLPAALEERRIDHYSRQAFEAIQSIGEPVEVAVDWNDEWREFNG